MSNSTNAHLRYNILDYCFRNKSYSFDELLKVVNQGYYFTKIIFFHKVKLFLVLLIP